MSQLLTIRELGDGNAILYGAVCWQCMAIYGGVWQYMAKYGSDNGVKVWQCMDKCGIVRQCVTVYNDVWWLLQQTGTLAPPLTANCPKIWSKFVTWR